MTVSSTATFQPPHTIADSTLRNLKGHVQSILEHSYKMDINMTDKILENYFSTTFLPLWYFHSNSAEDIASHFFITTQLLNATTEFLTQVSDDGKVITYFANVGRDFPGKLASIIKENLGMGIVAFDSVKTRSGIRIITIEKAGRTPLHLSEHEQKEIEELIREVRHNGKKKQFSSTESFVNGVPVNYLKEEIHNYKRPRRILRHHEFYEKINREHRCIAEIHDTANETPDQEQIETHELRIQVGVPNPNSEFIPHVLEIMKNRNINLGRSYFDLFTTDTEETIGIMSMYVRPDIELDGIIEALESVTVHLPKDEEQIHHSLSEKLEILLKTISSKKSSINEVLSCIKELRELIVQNTDIEKREELWDFLLNSLSDLYEAITFLGIDDNLELLQHLLGFDSFEEFWVSTKHDNQLCNTEGFRTKHNSVRGPNKGGIRIDLIVEFVEVAALSFMMTWKCARSKILFGGGKGGLKLNPRTYKDNRIEFFDTLTNFGRSLFLVTGPSFDVPAGDVGCGAEEIGHMFEGFKSALRDLAIMAFGIKQGVGIIGNKVISVEQARSILAHNFDIDYRDKKVLSELVTSEKFLELVAAPQITGKPRMGIAARTGATGRGLCYSILATVGKLYLDGKWQPEESLDDDETRLLEKVSRINERRILEQKGEDLITPTEWESLDSRIYKKLLKEKRVIVQGSGKVGASILKELDRYEVNTIAVGDVGGAVIGEHLDVTELLSQVSKHGVVIGAKKNVRRLIEGAKEGAAILELSCDILIPAALENAVSVYNAHDIKAKIEACGSNGTNTSKAETILSDRGVTVIYDFLANGAGVTASYFEWLRNLAERFRYEAEVIQQEPFDIDIMDKYIMPEFKNRIKAILLEEESPETTKQWNGLLRDIMFAAVNDDYEFSKENGISMRTAGFVNSILRVLSATILKASERDRKKYWKSLPEKVKQQIEPFLHHPESMLLNPQSERVIKDLYARKGAIKGGR